MNSWSLASNILSLLGVIALGVIAVLIIVFLRRPKLIPNEPDLINKLEKLQKEKSSLETTLAVEVQKTSKAQELEKKLNEKNSILETTQQQKAIAETTLLEKSNILKKLEEKQILLETNYSELQQENSKLLSRTAVLQEALDQERKQSQEKLKLLQETKESMVKEFELLANKTMKEHGENFSKQNKDQISGLLDPLKEKIGEFQQGLQQAHTESTTARATLAEQIRTLSETSSRMNTETVNLTRALKGESHTQGAWGEMILESILEKSGLRKGEEYTVQQSHTTDEGNKLRPDVLVSIPGGLKIVIDSKVSLASFEAYVNAENEDESALHMASHLTSIKNHIKNLSNKEYQWTSGSGLNYVIMFIPIEGALAAALYNDPQITSFSVEQNVAIATPTTLMMALRTVASVWQMERRNQNADAIASRAGKIYDKFVGFVTDMQGLGSRLTSTQEFFSDAMNKLSLGRGNLIGQVEQLKALGAKTSKSLPENLVDNQELAERMESYSIGLQTKRSTEVQVTEAVETLPEFVQGSATAKILPLG